MNSLTQFLLPVDVLVHGWNAACASLLACLIAIVLSRRGVWSLPARHAVLVAGLGVSLAAPLFAPIFRLPSLWEIGAVQVVDRPPPSRGPAPIGIEPEEVADSPRAIPVPIAQSAPAGPAETERRARSTIAAAADPPLVPKDERRALTASDALRVIGTLLCGIWLAGVAFGIAGAIHGLARLRRWMQSVAVADSPALTEAARWSADRVGLHGEVSLYRCNLLPAPVAFGLFRPRLVVPTGLEQSLAGDQLRAVIQHEVAHIARRDPWIGLLQQAAQIVYWWNPLVHLASRQLADLREQICDDIAIRELADPDSYAATLLALAERCTRRAPVPSTLGIGASSASQLEKRIRRIVSSQVAPRVRLTRLAALGASAAAILMTATILLAQVQVVAPSEAPTDDPIEATGAGKRSGQPPAASAAGKDPSLHDLIQQMADFERMYLPFDIKAMETFRFPDDLTPQERSRSLRADGRKHQRLMEYAQLARRIWRRKETILVDDEVEQGPYEQFSDGERIVQVSPGSIIIDGETIPEIHINNRKNDVFNYLHATPLYGIYCLSAYGNSEPFSKVFEADRDAVDLTWDNGDARLTFTHGHPQMTQRFVLWLSRAHDWHPIRLQRFWGVDDKHFHDEWEVTRFVRRGTVWRVAEGTHRYRNLQDQESPEPRLAYSMDFVILEEKYGGDVDERQFQYEIPAGAKVLEENDPEAELPAETREVTVTVADVEDRAIPNASIRLGASRSRDPAVATTDDRGEAHFAKAPAGNVSVHIAAAGFRPATWILGNVNQLRGVLAPETPGVVVDDGKPAADVWITNESLQVRADGIVHVRQRELQGADQDWSDSEGRFQLQTNLTLRRRDALVPFIAVGPSLEKMAIRFVPARQLGQRQELVLESVCHVHGHCLLQGMAESVEVEVGLEASTGQHLGFLSTRRELTPEGLRVDYQLRLPPGDYALRSRASSHHAGFAVPFTIAPGENELDLGTATVPAAGAVALRGKPAPELAVQWRPGQETTWEDLRGQVVVLDFWGTWCGPCVGDMPLLMEIADQFRGQGVHWIAIHTPNLKTFDDLDREIAICQEASWNSRALPFTTVLDGPLEGEVYSGKTSRRYGVATWPVLIVADQQGQVVGPIPKNRLAETIARLLDRGTDG